MSRRQARPISVVATASTGVAKAKFDIDTEDTITLTCQWQNLEDGSLATGARQLRCHPSLRAMAAVCSVSFGSCFSWIVALLCSVLCWLLAATSRLWHLSRRLILAVDCLMRTRLAVDCLLTQCCCRPPGVYTSSWIAPKSDVHSQQRFFYMGQGGEVNVDQAHRGYNVAVDGSGFATVNPLFMKYEPTSGKFSGQLGYGYRSFEAFIGETLSDIQQLDHKLLA